VESGRSLLIRGSFTSDDMKLMIDNLDPRGLFIHIMIQDEAEVDPLKKIAGM
jgi:hypothetical protein